MKTNIKIIFLALASIMIGSCKSDFLDISDPNNPTLATFYTSIDNAQLALDGVYGEFHDEYLYFGEYFYVTMFSTGEAEYVHPESRYTDFNNYNYGSTNSVVSGFYTDWYRLVGRANNVLDGLKQMKKSGNFSDSDLETIDKMTGQCYFLRGLGYSFLIRSFGQKMPSHPSYKPELPGVILIDSVLTTKEQMYKDRNTCGEVWEAVVKDFRAAGQLLPESWPAEEAGKATKGAAQAFLGETYVYLQDWDNARNAFDKVLANSNYQLMADFAHNFDYKHINNSESIFEVGFNNMTNDLPGAYTYRLLALQSWGASIVRNSTIDKFSSSVVINAQTLDAALKAKATVVGSVYKGYIDELVRVSTPLSGNSYAGKEAFLNEIRSLTSIPFYRADGVTYEKGVQQFLNAVSPKDPRLETTVYTPKTDSIVVFNPSSGKWKKTLFDYSNYGIKKYIPDSINVDNANAAGMGNDGHMSMNFRIMRLDDVYLYYAEVMHNLGDDVKAKEYLNKIVRRANGVDPEVQSSFDLSPDNLMAEIQNQTYLETCLEGKIWYHYRRWNIAAREWAKYGFVENKNECFPIPQGEFDSNPALTTQNAGY